MKKLDTNSIVLIGVDTTYLDKLGYMVACITSKMYLSFYELEMYEMQGIIGDYDNIDKEYMNHKILQSKIDALEFENAIFTVSINEFAYPELLSSINNLLTIFVKTPCTNNALEFAKNDREVFLISIADKVIELKEMQEQAKEIQSIIESN